MLTSLTALESHTILEPSKPRPPKEKGRASLDCALFRVATDDPLPSIKGYINFFQTSTVHNKTVESKYMKSIYPIREIGNCVFVKNCAKSAFPLQFIKSLAEVGQID